MPTKPMVLSDISKPTFILSPVSMKVFRTVFSSLNYLFNNTNDTDERFWFLNLILINFCSFLLHKASIFESLLYADHRSRRVIGTEVGQWGISLSSPFTGVCCYSASLITITVPFS